MNESTFLTPDEVATLTGRRWKSMQIEWLKRAGIVHWVNATGHPIVSRTTIIGQKSENEPKPRSWTPRVVGA